MGILEQNLSELVPRFWEVGKEDVVTCGALEGVHRVDLLEFTRRCPRRAHVIAFVEEAIARGEHSGYCIIRGHVNTWSKIGRTLDDEILVSRVNLAANRFHFQAAAKLPSNVHHSRLHGCDLFC